MNLSQIISPLAGIPLLLSLSALTSPAAVVTVTGSQTNGTSSLPHSFVPSTTDLIQGMAPSSQTGNFTQEGAGGAGVLTDGLFSSPVTRDLGGPFQFSSFATGGNTGGTSVTYLLGIAGNIGSIAVYGGWQDGGRDQQGYTILYSTAAAPGTFLPLTTVNYNPVDPVGQPQVTKVVISDTTGILASNVAALRFDFGATENGYSGYSEIDVIAVPEPGALGLLGLTVLGFSMGRRRR